jgi:hypothetical protein
MSESKSIKNRNPDRGPPMMEGTHQWNKGYEPDESDFSPRDAFPGDMERGNPYMSLQNEIVHRDSKKLKSNKFSKIA